MDFNLSFLMDRLWGPYNEAQARKNSCPRWGQTMRPWHPKNSYPRWDQTMRPRHAKTAAPGEARTHNLGMARILQYKYRALTDCATGAKRSGVLSLTWLEPRVSSHGFFQGWGLTASGSRIVAVNVNYSLKVRAILKLIDVSLDNINPFPSSVPIWDRLAKILILI